MPFLKLTFKPGVNRDQTNYSGEGGWWDVDKVRFFSGYPQKIGGWAKSTTSSFIGVTRQIFNWLTSFSDNFLAIGTNYKVYIEAGSAFYDITPIREVFDDSTTPSSTDTISTTNGSKVVTFTIAGHGLESRAFVTISGVTGNPGGVPNAEINTEHQVTVVSSSVFTILVATSATSTTSAQGGNAIIISCQINPGFDLEVLGYGWGTSGWGTVGWGLSSNQPLRISARDWWFDNFNNDLFINIRNGPIYTWVRGTSVSPTNALAARAVLLSSVADAADVPDEAMQILISQNDGHLLAFGATPFGSSSPDFDPMLIRWASQNAPEFWTPGSDIVVPSTGAFSSAGFIRVSRGSKIIRGLPTRQEIIVWTDSHLYSLQYTGTREVFQLQELSDNISIASPRACITANNVVYWMGREKFYIYDGRVSTLFCTIREYVFKDLNFNQLFQIVCGTNEGFTEVWWMYPSANSDINDHYAIYNHLDQVWTYGTLARTAWNDSPTREYPQATSTTAFTGSISGTTLTVTDIAVGELRVGDLLFRGDAVAPNTQITAFGTGTGGVGTYTVNVSQSVATTTIFGASFLYDHERGLNDDNAPMISYIQSSDFDLGEGEKLMLTRRIIPDLTFDTSTAFEPEAILTIRPRNFPGGRYQNDPSDTQNVIQTSVDKFTDQVFIRARARQMALKISSDKLNVQWQLGNCRLDAREDGKQ